MTTTRRRRRMTSGLSAPETPSGGYMMIEETPDITTEGLVGKLVARKKACLVVPNLSFLLPGRN